MARSPSTFAPPPWAFSAGSRLEARGSSPDVSLDYLSIISDESSRIVLAYERA